MSEDDKRIIAEWRERDAATTWRARLRTITNCGNEEVQVCTCSHEAVCPLGKAASQRRCTEAELEAYGRAKGWLS